MYIVHACDVLCILYIDLHTIAYLAMPILYWTPHLFKAIPRYCLVPHQYEMVVRLIPYRTAIGLVKQARCDILPRPKWRQELDQPSTHNDRTSTNPLLQDQSSLLGLVSLLLLNH
jgi:hypothetical protein